MEVRLYNIDISEQNSEDYVIIWLCIVIHVVFHKFYGQTNFNLVPRMKQNKFIIRPSHLMSILLFYNPKLEFKFFEICLLSSIIFGNKINLLIFLYLKHFREMKFLDHCQLWIITKQLNLLSKRSLQLIWPCISSKLMFNLFTVVPEKCFLLL